MSLRCHQCGGSFTVPMYSRWHGANCELLGRLETLELTIKDLRKAPARGQDVHQALGHINSAIKHLTVVTMEASHD